METGEVSVRNRPATAKTPPFFVKDYEARRIPLPNHTIDILLELHSEAPEQVPYILLSKGQYKTVVAKWQRYKEQGRAWCNKDIANNTLREFRRHLGWAGIKPNGTLSIHTLRKSCAQNWSDQLPSHYHQARECLQYEWQIQTAYFPLEI
jgi:integrase